MADPPMGLPVDRSATGPVEGAPRPGSALCLSGGGYRAMLFHLGALWRLNQFGYLPRLARVSSVSGGSITAGVLALAWVDLAFDQRGVGQRFEEEVVAPLRRLAGRTIDVGAVLKGALLPGRASDRVAGAYREHLFGQRTLQDLPADDAGPRFVFNAANLQSGALWRFSRPYVWDWKVGKIADPTLEVALAVAASSAFPPVLSPLVLRFDHDAFVPGTGRGLQKPPYTTEVHLTDGGVYDNLGLGTAWEGFRTVLVSNGGGKMAPSERPPWDPLRHTRRVLDVIDNQVRSLRVRQVLRALEAPRDSPMHRDGTYWGIRTDIADYHLADALPCPRERTMALAEIPTRLSKMDERSQEQLINWGYAVCDAAMRRWVDRSLPPPTGFPYPGSGVG